VREGQLGQYNFLLVVGQQEVDSQSVNVRTRENEVKGTLSISDLLEMFSNCVKNFE
jgi:threonyl-tRNA synthetase